MVVIFAVAYSHENCAIVNVFFLLKETGTETLEMLKTAYKDDANAKTENFSGFLVSKEV